MQTKQALLLLAAAGLSSALWAQSAPGVSEPSRGEGHIKQKFVFRSDMGKWWRDPEIAKKLQLNEGQVSQLDQVFYDHRIKLIDYGAEMEKQDLKLQTLLDADQPDEGQISSQVDLVLAARGKLEREYTFMNLDLRKQLNLDQWKQLKSIRSERGPVDHMFFFNKKIEGGPGSGMVIERMPPEAPPLPEPNL